MRLRIADPASVLVDRDVVAIRAEDASGSFGILDRHADFLTALEISVVSWREADGRAGYCAVRNGILIVAGGDHISIVTREAHLSDDLEQLEHVVLAGYRAHVEEERSGRAASARLRVQAIRRMVEALAGRRAEPEP